VTNLFLKYFEWSKGYNRKSLKADILSGLTVALVLIPQSMAYAVLLALMIGLFQFSLGMLKLGLVVNFISHPVVNGFRNAAALIIATSQLPKLLGVPIEKAPHHYEILYRVFKMAGHFIHWPTLLMGALAFLIMC